MPKKMSKVTRQKFLDDKGFHLQFMQARRLSHHISALLIELGSSEVVMAALLDAGANVGSAEQDMVAALLDALSDERKAVRKMVKEMNDGNV